MRRETMEYLETAGMTDWKPKGGRQEEKMMEGMAQLFHSANMTKCWGQQGKRRCGGTQ